MKYETLLGGVLLTLILTVPLSAETVKVTENGITEGKPTKRRGLITTSLCPYNCKSEGLSSESCRSWEEYGRCFVEDFTQAPGHRTRVEIPKTGAEYSAKAQR